MDTLTDLLKFLFILLLMPLYPIIGMVMMISTLVLAWVPEGHKERPFSYIFNRGALTMAVRGYGLFLLIVIGLALLPRNF